MAILRDVNVFFSGVDFWEDLECFSEKIPYAIRFSTLNIHGTDLGIEGVDIDTIDTFKETLSDEKLRVTIYTKNRKTVERFCDYNDIMCPEIIDANISGAESFSFPDGKKKHLILADDVVGNVFVQKRYKRTLAKNLDLLLQIKPGDYVVHVEHGIGIFRQILLKDLSGVKREYVEVEYRENDKLFVPVAELHRLSKYIGDDDPKLTRLDSTEWSRIMKGANEEIERIAQELLDIYANRALAKGFAFLPFTKEESVFRRAFPYVHTSDQEQVIQEVLADMSDVSPMDRLLSGDVGFGKTEVAMNAIYRAFLNKKQSVLISPLVVLAMEHFDSLSERLGAFGVRVAVISRVSTPKEERDVLK